MSEEMTQADRDYFDAVLNEVGIVPTGGGNGHAPVEWPEVKNDRHKVSRPVAKPGEF